MGEWFGGKDYFVAFTNTGGEILLSAWVRNGKALAPNPDEDQLAVIDFLQPLSKESYPSGCRSFEVSPDHLPTELDSPNRLAFLLEIIQNFARELTYDLPGLVFMELDWNHDLKIGYWLYKMLLLEEFVIETLSLKFNLIVSPIQLDLSYFDSLKVQFHQIASKRYQIDLPFHENTDPQEKLYLIEQLITLVKEEPTLTEQPDFLMETQFDYTVLLEKLGRKEEALAVLAEMSILNSKDDAVQSIVEDYIQQLKSTL